MSTAHDGVDTVVLESPPATPAAEPHVAQGNQWISDYMAATGAELVDVTLGTFTYTFDMVNDRVVCVTGTSVPPEHARDNARQTGHPAPEKGDHKGHLIAHSMGGGMDINIFAQNGALNLGNEWRGIERHAAANPDTPVAIHLNYEGDSDRPATIDYGYQNDHGEFVVSHFDNPAAS